jgi:hypothetical protein
VHRIRELVRVAVPAAATVLVVSRGDDELLKLAVRDAWHFPRNEDGRYAGYHPEDSAAAISHLEELRAAGAGYLLLPSTAFWWLDYYDEFSRHLERYEPVLDNEDCRIFRLVEGGGRDADKTAQVVRGRGADVPEQPLPILNELLESILPDGASVAVLTVAGKPAPSVPGGRQWHPQAPAADTAAATGELRELAERGIQFLVIPRAAFGWLRQHPALSETLRTGHRLVTRQRYVCEIYELSPAPSFFPPDGASPSPDTADGSPATASTSAPRKPSWLGKLLRRKRGDAG